jgi:hypothetical protein
MRPWFAVVVIAVFVAFPSSLRAQWPDYRQPGVPRTPDGKVDMNAPTPRTSDGKPDFTGVWENFIGNLSQPAGTRPPREALDLDGTPVATFFDIGAGFKDGLPLQPWAKQLKAQRMAPNSQDNPDAWCLPMGNLQFHEHPFPRKIVQTPKTIVILYESHQGIRQIHLDGRPLPNNDPQPWWYGYSVGRWEEDTLVVETTGFRDGGWLDINGSPLTDQGRTVERFRRPSYGQLEILVTINDPKAYTRPFTVKFNQRLMPDTDIMEMVCEENEQSTKHFAK